LIGILTHGNQRSTRTRPSAAPSGEPVVRFEDVSVGFSGPPVLKTSPFKVRPAETRILLGPAGGGKSVLIKLANGLIRPDSGASSSSAKTSPPWQRTSFKLRAHIGMVFQESALFDSLTVRRQRRLPLMEATNPSPRRSTERVREALRFVELEQGHRQVPVASLSGGMRRRVSIARAIITKPDLILYDSPTGGLDPITSTTIIELVVKQRDVSHTTSLLITHRLQDAFTMATHRYNQEQGHMEKIPDGGIDPSTRFLVLNEGQVVFDGTTLELDHTGDPWLKYYIS
jgi:phospholipid/cholesterol/gamma-HCH transport system ATP-binding protein